MDDAALTLATHRAIADAQAGAADRLPEWAENRLVFLLCQHLLGATNGTPVPASQLEPYVLAYWQATQGELDWEDAYACFTTLWDGHKVRRRKGNLLEIAEDYAMRYTEPRPELAKYSSHIQRLGHVCYELARLSGRYGQFFLSQRHAARILHRTQPAASFVIKRFCNEGILSETSHGNNQSHKASEYLYLHR